MKEEAELKMIRDNVKIVDGKINVKYPFVKDPSCLPNNRDQAVGIASKVWSSLKKDGLLVPYHEEIRKFLERGTFVMLSKEELESYEGPQQYISHHAVLKDSASTPLRVVTNSSLNNNGNSLNSCLAKGPNSLNDMFSIMLRFRCYQVVFLFDLSKAYNTMKTGVVEKHLRRLVWKFKEEDPWQDFAIDKVHYGDQPAAVLLEVSKQETAELGRHIDPEAADKIITETYVDDCPTGGSKEAVARMVGSRDAEGNYDGTIPKILALGGFKIKEFIVEGDMTQDDNNLLGNKVFGYEYNPKTRMMNLSKKKRGIRSKPNLTMEDIRCLGEAKMTKRILLGLVNSPGDFLGIASPFTIRLKLNMKKLFELDKPLSWDDEIPDQLREGWINLITEALENPILYFTRTTRPNYEVIEAIYIVGFADGSFAAFAACVYLVWEEKPCQKGSSHVRYFAQLLCSKCRVTPLDGFTIPRSELSGAVLLSRLMFTVIRALIKLGIPILGSIMLLDSTCSISTLEENARKLKPFFHNRRAEILDNIAEIRKLCPMEDVHFVPGKLNPADIATRGNTKITEMGPGSVWQSGPDFLCSPRSEWPITRDFIKEDVPDCEKRNAIGVFTVKLAVDIEESQEIMPKLHLVISRILKQRRNFKSSHLC